MSTAVASTTLIPAGTWNVDPTHSTIGFSVKHMMIATVRGRFTEFAGALTVDDGGHVRVTGNVAAASIDTNEPQRDEHLRSDDFFAAAAHPEITFVSTRVEPAGGDRLRIVGDLTIRGNTHAIAVDAEVLGTGTDPYGNERVALEVTGQITRKAFGLHWNQLLETGGVVVGDKITISLDLSTVKQA
jgi:polyisoprenoid-binding protein YceI